MKRFLWGLMAFWAVAIAVYALYLITHTDLIRANDVLREDLAQRAFALYGHLAGGAVGMVLGPLQFLRSVRQRHPRLHRWMGRTYVVACIVSALCGLVLAVHIDVGPIPPVGFSLLALAWLSSTTTAFLKARGRDFGAHERWMVRSYALTLAGVSLRIQLPLMLIGGVEFSLAYAIISLSCWVPNLLLAELFIKARKSSPRPVAA
ncbi:DUF2306 domain-containing protein [Kordiimonas marina]|uniref:DUF2306 domain-containing protein n=1 Tax=Kordiimonas marina TaxID=2872312 RepID=UPI001FF4928B|nr:DUF2306 domain-containing protein [Kordiimonas marina]MCJ9429257.1 DUF2306 domain-containing protein [Kordiimonas marina]